MTVKDALEHLKIGRTKFYSLPGEGKIRTVKIGKRTLLDPLDLKQFVEKQKQISLRGREENLNLLL